jgi:hypothetical protein
VGGLAVQHENYGEIIALFMKLHWLTKLRQSFILVVYQAPSKLLS